MKKTMVILLISVLIVGYLIYNYTKRTDINYDYSVAEYFPDREMIKVFDGGFENSGTIEIVDRFLEDRAQVRLVNHGAGAVLIYKLTENDIRLVYSMETEDMEEDFTAYPSNRDDIILQGPIKKGTKWINNGTNSEITGVDVNVITPLGEYKALEVTYKRDDYIYKSYYAKGLGLIKTVDEFYPSQLIRIDYDLEKIKNDDILDLLNKFL